MMRLFCRIGFHRWSCYSHRLGVPWDGGHAWVFNMHCLRCGKRRNNAYQLPPQPLRRPLRMEDEPHPDFSKTLG